jgi:hypothetical protein
MGTFANPDTANTNNYISGRIVFSEKSIIKCILIMYKGIFDGLEKDLKSYIVPESIHGSVLRVSFAQSAMQQGSIGLASLFPLTRLFKEKSLELLSNDDIASSESSIIQEQEDDEVEEDDELQQDKNIEQPSIKFRDRINHHPVTDKIDLTCLSYIPNKFLQKLMGRISLHFVKESNIMNENGTGSFGMVRLILVVCIY